jgi:predicted cobalt transporter CbtA
MSGRAKTSGSGATVAERTRPDHFSTYVPRSLVRRLKVVATIKDIPLWVLVTLALEDYLDAFQSKHGQLPALDDGSSRGRE